MNLDWSFLALLFTTLVVGAALGFVICSVWVVGALDSDWPGQP